MKWKSDSGSRRDTELHEKQKEKDFANEFKYHNCRCITCGKFINSAIEEFLHNCEMSKNPEKIDTSQKHVDSVD